MAFVSKTCIHLIHVLLYLEINCVQKSDALDVFPSGVWQRTSETWPSSNTLQSLTIQMVSVCVLFRRHHWLDVVMFNDLWGQQGLLVPVKTQDVSVSHCFAQEYLKQHEIQNTKNRLHRLYGK